MAGSNFDLRHSGRFVASCFKIAQTDVCIIANAKTNKTEVYFDFDKTPIQYLKGTDKQTIKESFDIALKRFKIMHGEPSEDELVDFRHEMDNALKRMNPISDDYDNDDLSKLKKESDVEERQF